jgi:hypothetical protein
MAIEFQIIKVQTQVNDVRRETAGMQRKILGSWKQYSDREVARFFSRWIPTTSRVFLQDPVTGTIHLRSNR